MKQARSGELRAELGQPWPNANQACRQSGNALGRPVTYPGHSSSPGRALRRVPDPVAFGWPPDRGPYTNTTNRMTSRDCCPRVEPRQN